MGMFQTDDKSNSVYDVYYSAQEDGGKVLSKLNKNYR